MGKVCSGARWVWTIVHKAVYSIFKQLEGELEENKGKRQEVRWMGWLSSFSPIKHAGVFTKSVRS